MSLFVTVTLESWCLTVYASTIYEGCHWHCVYHKNCIECNEDKTNYQFVYWRFLNCV